jgi:hypothetical protein
MTFEDFVRLIGLCHLFFVQNTDKINDISAVSAIHYPHRMIDKIRKKDYVINKVKVEDGIYVVQ